MFTCKSQNHRKMTRGHAPFHGAHSFPIFTRLLTAPRRAVSTSPPAGVTEWRILGQHDDLANRPERYAGKLKMRPSEGDAHDGNGEENCGDEMS
jgi:hypothetical protein